MSEKSKISESLQKKINLLTSLSLKQNAKFHVPVEKLTKRQKELRDAIDKNDFGCSKGSIRKLVEVITGVIIPEPCKNEAVVQPFMCFTRTDSRVGARIVVSSRHDGYNAIRTDETGQYDNPLASTVKLCNEKEIRAFLAIIPERTLDINFGQIFIANGI